MCNASAVKLLLCALALVLLSQVSLVSSQQYFKGWQGVFPFEPCYRDPTQSRYRINMDSYSERNTSVSTFCLRVTVLDAGQCFGGSNRCCNTDFKKLKLWPRPECAGSVDSFTINNGKVSKAITWEQDFDRTIVKLTPLFLNLTSANNTLICINLKAPCNTLPLFNVDSSGSLQYAMYDTRRGDYECCPLGEATWADVPLAISYPPPPSPPRAPTRRYRGGRGLMAELDESPL